MCFDSSEPNLCVEHAGSSTLINSGCVLVRNSRWARTFLSEWWRFADRTLFSDQEQFDLVYESRRRYAEAAGDERSFLDKIVILPPDKLNSDPPAMILQKPYNAVLHLMVSKHFICFFFFICDIVKHVLTFRCVVFAGGGGALSKTCVPSRAC